MSSEAKKIELIMWISLLKDKSILDSLWAMKQKALLKKMPVRRAGWAKDIILYVAPDFDETPQGYEEYIKPNA